jgi:hypothetical protein
MKSSIGKQCLFLNLNILLLKAMSEIALQIIYKSDEIQ